MSPKEGGVWQKIPSGQPLQFFHQAVFYQLNYFRATKYSVFVCGQGE